MRNLSQYKKLYLSMSIAFLVYIALLIVNFAIKMQSPLLVVFTVIAYFPLFSIVYSMLSHKYYHQFGPPLLIYTIFSAGISILLFCLVAIALQTALNEELGYSLLVILCTIPFVIVSIILVLILLLVFKFTVEKTEKW